VKTPAEGAGTGKRARVESNCELVNAGRSRLDRLQLKFGSGACCEISMVYSVEKRKLIRVILPINP
jgi:hypothetical protein